MLWGVHLPHLGRQATGPNLARFARRADELGYHSAWVSDHVAWPWEIASRYPYREDGSFPGANDMPWLDPLGTLFYVAACTERIRLGTTVQIMGYRNPVLSAKAWASLDVVSGGRAILGVGVGWMREEFEVLGMPSDHRGARADEQLAVYEELFTAERPSFEGNYYRFDEIGFSPKPVQGRIPIWVGGDTEPAWRRTVRSGDAFHAAFQPLDEVAAAWTRIGELCREAGRDRDGELLLSVRLHHDPDRTQDPATSIAGTADEQLDTVRRWRDIGVGHLLLDPVGRGGIDRRVDELGRFMDEVASRLD